MSEKKKRNLESEICESKKAEYFPLVSVRLVKDGRMKYTPMRNLTDSEIIYNQFRRIFDHQIQEKVVCAYVDTQLGVLGAQIVGIGSGHDCVVDKPGIFRSALLIGASGIVLMHNHPSGSLFASDEDIACTKEMIRIGKLIGIPMIDHIIFADEGYHSMRSSGEIVF